MREFEKAFKLPFKIKDMGSWCVDANDQLCFQTVDYLNKESKALLELSLKNKTIKRQDVYYDGRQGYIYVDEKPFISIRGWGYLTGTGGLNLSDDEAVKIQDDLANYLVEQLQG